MSINELPPTQSFIDLTEMHYRSAIYCCSISILLPVDILYLSGVVGVQPRGRQQRGPLLALHDHVELPERRLVRDDAADLACKGLCLENKFSF